jgi:poly(hydroxyalkanoate) depolymerase family esterase
MPSPFKTHWIKSTMNEDFNRDMASATRLTQAGKLVEATTLLQRLLRGSVAPAETKTEPSPAYLNSPVIDATAVTIPETVASQSVVRRFLSRLKSGGDQTARHEAKQNPASRPTHPVPVSGQFIAGSFSNDAGSRNYKLYIPTKHARPARPLVVMLHGCSQTADDFAAGTRMNICADEHDCFVVYPEQAKSANASKCWNWFNGTEQVRGRGEPSLIAGITREVVKTYNIDPRRIYIAGLSAGGAASATLAETYPDLYAAVGIHSGLACGAARDMPSAFAAMSGRAQSSLLERAADRQFVPTIVFHGDRDATVHPRNGANVVARANSMADLQSLTETGSAGGRSYRRSVYRDGRGNAVIEDWLLHGAGHAWSGGSTLGSFADSKGPDASREMLRFFLSHRLVD